MARNLTIDIKAQNEELKKKLKESQRELAEFKRAVKAANSDSNTKNIGGLGSILDSIKTKAGGANGVLSLLTGGLGKLAGGLGIAMGAGEVFNRMLENSDTLGDLMTKTTMQASNAVDFFAMSLVRCDFSGFLNGLSNAISAAGDLADILDDIDTSRLNYAVSESFRNVEISKLRNEAYEEKDPKKRAEKLKKVEEEERKALKASIVQGRKEIQGGYEILKTKAFLSPEEMKALGTQQGQALLDTFYRNKEGLKAYTKDLDNLEKKASGNKGQVVGMGFNAKLGVDENSRKELEHYKNSSEGMYASIAKKLYEINDGSKEIHGGAQLIVEGNNKISHSYDRLGAAAKKASNAEDRANKHASGRNTPKGLGYMPLQGYGLSLTPSVSTDQLEANVKYLEEMKRKTLLGTEEWRKYNKELELTKMTLEAANAESFVEGSKAKIEAQLSMLQRARDNTLIGGAQYENLTGEINALIVKLDDINNAESKITKSQINFNDTTIRGLKKQMAYWEQELQYIDPMNVDAYKKVQDEIEKVQDKLATPVIPGSLAAMQREVEKLRKKFQEAGTEADRMALKAQIAEKEGQIQDAERGYSLPKALGSGFTNDQNKKMDIYNQSEQKANQIQMMVSVGIMGKDEAMKEIEELNKVREQFGLKPLEIKVMTPGMQKALKTTNQIADAIGSMGDMLSTLGSAFEAPELDVAGIIAQTLANLALSASKAIGQSTDMGPWGWLAFSAMAMAQLAAMVAQIHSATSGYANGGIIGGTSYNGDKLYARVNSGEMILNSRQQRNLFNAIDDNRISSGNGTSNMSFTLYGSDIYGSLSTYMKMTGKKL